MVDINDVFDKFGDEDFIGAKEDLKYIIRKKTNDHIKNKLELQADPFPDVEPKEDGEEGEE